MSYGTPVPFVQAFSAPSAASTTTAGAAFSLAYPSSAVVIVATLTGMSASTLDLYVQESWDAGVTWIDAAHFAQLAIGAAASSTRLAIAASSTTPLVVGVGTVAAPGVALAAGKFVDGPWGPLLRIVSVTGAGVNAGPVVQTLRFYAWQSVAI